MYTKNGCGFPFIRFFILFLNNFLSGPQVCIDSQKLCFDIKCAKKILDLFLPLALICFLENSAYDITVQGNQNHHLLCEIRIFALLEALSISRHLQGKFLFREICIYSYCKFLIFFKITYLLFLH